MTNLSEFELTQQAVEMLLKQYDVLLVDYSRHEACTILAARHQIQRHKIVTLTNDRDGGYLGSSGTTIVSVVSTPPAAAYTA